MTDRNGTPTAPGSDPRHGLSGQAVPSPTPLGPHTSAGRSELGGRVAAHDDTSATEPSGVGRAGAATPDSCKNGSPTTPEDRTYRCAVCGQETVITRGNATPPLPWPDPNGWTCWRSECSRDAASEATP